jgi:transcription elongation factor GreA
MKAVYLTKEGEERLQKELKNLIEVDRKAVIDKVKEAREYGDLSENSEYEAATHEQGLVESRIDELQQMLKNVRIIDAAKNGISGKVSIGSKVEVEIEGDKESFLIVGSAESDPAKGFISSESPLGKALLGCKVGDKARVTITDGAETEYKILAIS